MYNRIQGYVDDLAGLAHGTAGLVIGEKEGYDSEGFPITTLPFHFYATGYCCNSRSGSTEQI